MGSQAPNATVKEITANSVSGRAGLGALDLQDVLRVSRLLSRIIALTKGSQLKPDAEITPEEGSFLDLAIQVKMFYHPKYKIGRPQMDYNLGLATYLTLVSDLVKNDNLEQVVQGRYPTKPLDSLTYSKRNNYLLWNNVGYEYNYSFSIIKMLRTGREQRLYLFVVESERAPETAGKSGDAIETYDACVVHQTGNIVQVSFEQCRDHQLGMLSKVAKMDLSYYAGKELRKNAFTEASSAD